MFVLAIESEGLAEATAAIEVHREVSVIWTETSIKDATDEDSTLKVDIFKPFRDGRRTLWQRCTFPTSGSGPYRCGVDAKAARKYPGNWVAKAYLDRTLIGSKRFVVD